MCCASLYSYLSRNKAYGMLMCDEQVLLLSPPLSYPLPLLSLTTHLALLSTRLPALVSQGDEDPLFNDDWEASTPLYASSASAPKPPITLLVMSVTDTILFDPSRDELAVADSVLAISATQTGTAGLKVIALRTIDPPSRLTAAGVPSALNSASGGAATASAAEVLLAREKDEGVTTWRPARGGVKRAMISRMIKMVVEEGGVGEEIMKGLEGVEIA
jgi:exosome complex component RRP42